MADELKPVPPHEVANFDGELMHVYPSSRAVAIETADAFFVLRVRIDPADGRAFPTVTEIRKDMLVQT